MWATQVVAAGALAGTIVLASCGNSGNGATADEPVSTEDTGPAGDGAAPTVRPCLVLPLEEVEALVGAAVTAGPSPHSGSTGCEWTAEVVGDDDSRESRLVDLQVLDVATALDEALTLDGQPTDVEGLGDQALLETSNTGPPAVMVAYRDAERVVSLRYEVQGVGTAMVDPREDPDSVVDTLRTLATSIAQPAG
jgi:hypothetical protein